MALRDIPNSSRQMDIKEQDRYVLYTCMQTCTVMNNFWCKINYMDASNSILEPAGRLAGGLMIIRIKDCFCPVAEGILIAKWIVPAS